MWLGQNLPRSWYQAEVHFGLRKLIKVQALLTRNLLVPQSGPYFVPPPKMLVYDKSSLNFAS